MSKENKALTCEEIHKAAIDRAKLISKNRTARHKRRLEIRSREFNYAQRDERQDLIEHYECMIEAVEYQMRQELATLSLPENYGPDTSQKMAEVVRLGEVEIGEIENEFDDKWAELTAHQVKALISFHQGLLEDDNKGIEAIREAYKEMEKAAYADFVICELIRNED